MDSKITSAATEEQKNCPLRSKLLKQGTGSNVMEKLWKHEDVEPLSEADAKAEWDEWQKQAIMDDKAQ